MELTREYFDERLRILETNLSKKIDAQTEQFTRIITHIVAANLPKDS